MNLKIGLQYFEQRFEVERHHWVFIIPYLRFTCGRFFNAEFQRLLITFARVIPTWTERKIVLRLVCGMSNKQIVADLIFIYHVKAEYTARFKRFMNACNARFQILDAIVVMDGVSETSDQI